MSRQRSGRTDKQRFASGLEIVCSVAGDDSFISAPLTGPHREQSWGYRGRELLLPAAPPAFWERKGAAGETQREADGCTHGR